MSRIAFPEALRGHLRLMLKPAPALPFSGVTLDRILFRSYVGSDMGVEAQPARSQTDPSSLTDHQMIEHVHAKQPARRDDLTRHSDVFGRRQGIARRVVMRQDDLAG